MGTLLRITGSILTFSTRGKGAMGPLLSAPAGASKRETTTSNLTENTVQLLQEDKTIGVFSELEKF